MLSRGHRMTTRKSNTTTSGGLSVTTRKPGIPESDDRSWYGRVLVERVEGFCSETEWEWVYQEINEMEQDYVESSGGATVSFGLTEIRMNSQTVQPAGEGLLKQYKITEDDWRNREKWDLYDVAVDEMLARTNTPYAPWIVIESDNKWYARVKALQEVIRYTEKLL